MSASWTQNPLLLFYTWMISFPSHLAPVGCSVHKQYRMVRRGPEPDQKEEHLGMSVGKQVSGAGGDVSRRAVGLI